MGLARPLACSLLALLGWGFSAPLVAVTCVPSAPCAGLGVCPLEGRAASSSGPVVGPPDCCEQSARESSPPGLPGAPLAQLAQADLPVASIAGLPPAPVAASSNRPTADPAARAVPLYTLHSILLI